MMLSTDKLFCGVHLFSLCSFSHCLNLGFTRRCCVDFEEADIFSAPWFKFCKGKYVIRIMGKYSILVLHASVLFRAETVKEGWTSCIPIRDL